MAQEHNPLGTIPIARLVVNMSWPIMLSMLVQAVYNLVDSLYVTRISDSAFLALSYAYPIQILMAAFCVGVGVGFNAVLGQRLGAKKAEEANSVVLHGFLLYAVCWLLFFLFGLFACETYLRFCTDTADVVWQGAAYLRICCCFSFGMCAQFPCERILQSTGHPVGFMIVQGSGALLNMILDPIFIFGFHMGVQGAAVATVIGQIIGGFVGVFLVRRIRYQFPITLNGVSFQLKLIREVWDIAAPAILVQSLSSLMSLGLNFILNLCSETAVWVLGVYFKLQSFVFMPIFSINNALVSIISYNYGASDKARVSDSIRFGLAAALSAGLTGTVLQWLCTVPLLSICFRAGETALAIGIPALRMTALSFPVAAISITRSAAFQSLGYSRYSLFLSLLRTVIFLLPIALLLVLLSPQWVFISFLFSETAACLVSWVLFRRVKQKKIDLI